MTETAECSMCGKMKNDCHPISFDSVGESYVDVEAGDMLCSDCYAKQRKKLEKRRK